MIRSFCKSKLGTFTARSCKRKALGNCKPLCRRSYDNPLCPPEILETKGLFGPDPSPILASSRISGSPDKTLPLTWAMLHRGRPKSLVAMAMAPTPDPPRSPGSGTLSRHRRHPLHGLRAKQGTRMRRQQGGIDGTKLLVAGMATDFQR